jgi:WD40 repeat protein
MHDLLPMLETTISYCGLPILGLSLLTAAFVGVRRQGRGKESHSFFVLAISLVIYFLCSAIAIGVGWTLVDFLAENTDPPAYHVAWQPGGDILAVSGRDLRLYTDSLEEIIRLENDYRDVIAIAWHPGGKIIAEVNNEVRIWDVESRQVVASFTPHPYTCCISWSPDGTRIATAGSDDTVKVWDVQTLELVYVLEGQTDQIYAVAWSPSSEMVAVTSHSSNETVRIWDAATGNLLYAIPTSISAYSLSWSQSSTLLAVAGISPEIQIWDLINQQLQVTLHPPDGRAGIITALDWSPDNTRFAVARSSLLQIWDVATGQLLSTLSGHSGSIDAVVWNQDGSKLASTATDGTLRMWDVATGTLLHMVEADDS